MPEHENLKRHAVSGAKWIGLATVVTAALQFLQVAMLTRFLSPGEFGLMAMAMFVYGIAQAFNDMGISNAIIQRKDTTRDRLSSLFWLEIAVGFGLFLLTLISTPLAVGFYNEPALAGVMLWISVIFLVTPPGQIFMVLLQKELRFRKLALIEILASVTSLIVTVAAAYFGLGVMALVIGQICYFGIRSLQFVAVGLPLWRPHLHFSTSDLRGYIGFGMCQMGERTVTYLSINVINLIIGRYLGAGALGQYSVAYQMIVYPVLRLNNVIMSVSFPIFAKFQDMNEMLRQGYLHLSRAISFATFPVIVVAFVAAPIIVPLLLGPGWSEVTPVFRILCAVAIFRALGSTTVPTYLAKGRADLGFTWNFVVAAVNGIVFYFTASYGIIALGMAFAATSLLQFVVMQTITGRMIELKWNAYLRSMALVSAKSAITGAVVYALYLAGTGMGMDRVVLLAAMLTVGIFVYTAMAIGFNLDYLKELWGLVAPQPGSKKRIIYCSAANVTVVHPVQEPSK
jgi:O-antigen/teichoic acid export membrane protein